MLIVVQPTGGRDLVGRGVVIRARGDGSPGRRSPADVVGRSADLHRASAARSVDGPDVASAPAGAPRIDGDREYPYAGAASERVRATHCVSSGGRMNVRESERAGRCAYAPWVLLGGAVALIVAAVVVLHDEHVVAIAPRHGWRRRVRNDVGHRAVRYATARGRASSSTLARRPAAGRAERGPERHDLSDLLRARHAWQGHADALAPVAGTWVQTDRPRSSYDLDVPAHPRLAGGGHHPRRGRTACKATDGAVLLVDPRPCLRRGARATSCACSSSWPG